MSGFAYPTFWQGGARLLGDMLLGLVIALATPAAALGQSSAGVEGQVVHGANPGADLSGLPVVLHQHGAGDGEDVPGATDGEGRFRFQDVAVVPGFAYGVSVEYQGALYGRDVALAAGQTATVSLTVYDATHDASVLQVASASTLFASVDQRHQWVGVLEMVSLRNASDHTFVPGPEPMNLLRFDLPPGATALEVQTALVGTEVLQVERGFGLNASVPPGNHDLLWVYQFPYSGSFASFARSFLYETGQLRFLIPQGEVSLESLQMGLPETVIIGSRAYQVLTTEGLAAGQGVEVTLVGLPEPTLVDRLARATEAASLQFAAPGALAVVALVVVIYALVRSKRRRRPAGGREEGDGDGVALETPTTEGHDG